MVADIVIKDEINFESFHRFSKKLARFEAADASRTAITIELASDGGSAYAALAFASRIRTSPLRITILAYGYVASAAVLLLAAGDHRRITQESWVMVHEDSGEPSGTVAEMEKYTKHLRRLEDQWATLLEELTGTPAAVWTRLHAAETYLTASECLKLGLVDKVI